MKTQNLLFGAAALTCIAGFASADTFIGIGDFSGNETVITFNDFDMTTLDPDLADITNGITVANNGGGTGGPGWRGNIDWSNLFANIPGASLGLGLADQWGASDLTYNLPAGIQRFGLLLSTGTQTTWSVEVRDTNGNLLGGADVTMPAANEAVFVGFESSSGDIGTVRLIDEENGFITIMDDVRFEGTGGPAPCPEDINGDGVVDVQDLLALLAAWGPCDNGGPEVCETGFTCGEPIENCPSSDNPICFCFTGFNGDVICGLDSSCGDLATCFDGNCPPGTQCAIDTCCVDPVCVPVCDDRNVSEFQPGDLTTRGVVPAVNVDAARTR